MGVALNLHKQRCFVMVNYTTQHRMWHSWTQFRHAVIKLKHHSAKGKAYVFCEMDEYLMHL